MKKEITKEMLLNTYNKHKSIGLTAKELNINYGTVKSKLIKFNIPIKSNYNSSSIDKNELIKIYSETKSVRKTAEYFKCSHEKIRELCHIHNICNEKIIHICNEDFFINETEESFYWAGFIAADGCVKQREKRYELYIALSQKDKNHLEKFKIAINTTAPIHDYLVKNSKRNSKWNDSWKSEIAITSKKVFEDLSKFNIAPRKSLIYTFPDWLVDHKLVNHFMRGYNDGDGSFFKKNKIASQIYFSLRGTKEFLTIYRSILEKDIQIKKQEKPIRINCGTGVLEYGGNNVIKQISSFLYKDATIYLERKHDKIKNI